MTDIVCPNCSNSNPEVAQVCEYCGHALVEGAKGFLDSLEPPEPDDEDQPIASPPAEPTDLDPDLEAPAEPGEVPDWLQRIRERQAEEEGEPAAPILEATSAEARDEPDPSSDAGEAPPFVPPLMTDPAADDADELDLESLGLPDWLGDVEPDEHDELEPEPVAASDLAQATLPSWVEAMRPVDTFRSVVEQEGDDGAPETAGPLAGLQGVLLAEPVVAMPRTSSIGSMQLDVTERQYSQAELLQDIVDQEQTEPPAAPGKKAALPIFRWVISAITLLAVALPVFLAAPPFAAPQSYGRELDALTAVVGELPVDDPVLLVFDYDPSYTGELNAVASPLIEALMSRGVPVASMSTRTSGAPMAEVVLINIGERHGYVSGVDFVNLGYLSGGPTAVQTFAERPTEAILQGFGESAGDLWQSPALQDVQNLSDFGMVAVITAGTETARVWIEQTDRYLGATPLVMVLSAGAEPMVWPYFEADIPQVDGILSGLPSAFVYEVRNGQPGSARQLWGSFGSAMFASELILIAGLIYGGYYWWLRSREG